MSTAQAKAIHAKMGKGASTDKRMNAEKYVRGVKPTKHSEYFGKSYSQLQRESRSSK